MTGNLTQCRSSRIETAILYLLVALCVSRFWLMPLSASFWVDESVTAFVVDHPHDPSFSIAPQVPLSLYYLFPRCSTAALGNSEIAYRLPSLFFSVFALWFIARLAARLISGDAAWFVVLACLSLRGLNLAAIDARPYALGILLASASLFLLVRWLDYSKWIDAMGFALAAALLWRVQLVFWPFYLVYGIYAAIRLTRHETSVRLRQVLTILVVVGLLLLPVAWEAIGILRQAGAHVIAQMPTWRDLQHGIRLPFVIVCLVVAWLLQRLSRRPAVFTLPVSSFCLCFSWWLVVPAAIFTFSWVSGKSIFVSRYYSEATPGVAFAAAALSAPYLPPHWWKRASIVFGIGVLVYVGDWSTFRPRHSPSQWREASQAIIEAGSRSDTPVICPSPFIEAQAPLWHPDYPVPDFLSCHLLRYPFPGTIFLFPFGASPEAKRFADRLAYSKLPSAHKFFIYGAGSNVRYWRDWFAGEPHLAGWSHHSLGNFGDVDAVVFEAQ